MAGFLPAAIALGGGASDFLVIVLGAVGLSAVGTVDDRVGLGPLFRVLAELAAAFALWNADLGWSVFHSEAANLILTLVWVVGLVNAFNLMDNVDGATGTIGMVCAAGAAGAALLDDNVLLAALALALSGACAGFLPYNLSGPSRVFLGDGGSMPIGFVAAAAVMAAPADVGVSATAVLVAAPLVGLPILDTTLVTVSRIRRGVQVMTGAATTSPTACCAPSARRGRWPWSSVFRRRLCAGSAWRCSAPGTRRSWWRRSSTSPSALP